MVETLRVPEAEKIAVALANEFPSDRDRSLSATLRNHCQRPPLNVKAHALRSIPAITAREVDIPFLLRVEGVS